MPAHSVDKLRRRGDTPVQRRKMPAGGFVRPDTCARVLVGHDPAVLLMKMNLYRSPPKGKGEQVAQLKNT